MVTVAYDSIVCGNTVCAHNAESGKTYYLEDGTRVHVRKSQNASFRAHFVQFPQAYNRGESIKFSPEKIRESLVKSIFAAPGVSEARSFSGRSATNRKKSEKVPHTLAQLHRLRLDLCDEETYEPYAEIVIYARYYLQAEWPMPENRFRAIEATPFIISNEENSITFVVGKVVMDDAHEKKYFRKTFTLKYRSQALYYQQLYYLGLINCKCDEGVPNNTRVLIAGLWDEIEPNCYVSIAKTKRQLLVIKKNLK